MEVIFLNAKNKNHDFIAITDYHNLHGLYKILKLSETYNIPAIIGLEMNLFFEETLVKLLVYARNDLELETLIKLSSYMAMDQKIKKL